MTSGVKSVGKGVLIGVGSIIGLPIVGAKEKGAPGFVGGLLGGVLFGAAMITTGAGLCYIY